MRDDATHMRIRCPHCSGKIRIGINVQAIGATPMGPPAYDPGPEVDAYVIDKVENHRVSFRTLCALLEDRDIPTARGSKKWHAASASRLYQNAVNRREAKEEAS